MERCTSATVRAETYGPDGHSDWIPYDPGDAVRSKRPRHFNERGEWVMPDGMVLANKLALAIEAW